MYVITWLILSWTYHFLFENSYYLLQLLHALIIYLYDLCPSFKTLAPVELFTLDDKEF